MHQADPHPAWERTDMVRPVAGSGLAWGTGGTGFVHQADPHPAWERTDMARPVAGWGVSTGVWGQGVMGGSTGETGGEIGVGKGEGGRASQ